MWWWLLIHQASLQIPSCSSTVSASSQREEENCFIQTQCSRDFLVNVSWRGEEPGLIIIMSHSQIEDSYKHPRHRRYPSERFQEEEPAQTGKFEVIPAFQLSSAQTSKQWYGYKIWSKLALNYGKGKISNKVLSSAIFYGWQGHMALKFSDVSSVWPLSQTKYFQSLKCSSTAFIYILAPTWFPLGKSHKEKVICPYYHYYFMLCYVFLWKLLSFATINNQRSSIQLVASQKVLEFPLSVSDSTDKVQDKSWSWSYLAVPLDVRAVQSVLLVLLFGHHFWELQDKRRLKTIIISRLRLQHNCSGLFRDKKAIKHRHYKVQILVKICSRQKTGNALFYTQ